MASQRDQKTRPTVLTSSIRTTRSTYYLHRVTTVLPWYRVYIPSARGRVGVSSEREIRVQYRRAAYVPENYMYRRRRRVYLRDRGKDWTIFDDTFITRETRTHRYTQVLAYTHRHTLHVVYTMGHKKHCHFIVNCSFSRREIQGRLRSLTRFSHRPGDFDASRERIFATDSYRLPFRDTISERFESSYLYVARSLVFATSIFTSRGNGKTVVSVYRI